MGPPERRSTEADPLAPEVRALVGALGSGSGRPRVALDADGTLWRGDVGEDLLRFLAQEDRLPRYRGRRDLYAEYERRVAVDPADGFAFAVRVMEDVEEAALATTCATFFRQRYEGRIFPFARRLIRDLAAAGAEPWMVSASPIWAVLPGAELLGIPSSNVIGVRAEISGGRLTREVIQPVPTAQGKVHWLKAQGVRPALAAGNSPLDVPMLEYAERAIWVAPHDGPEDLARLARARGWAVQRC